MLVGRSGHNASHGRKKQKDVYVYFDNDQNAYSAFNAIALKELVATLSEG
jgi:uncharacterized protein YecE (DUF72 family)